MQMQTFTDKEKLAEIERELGLRHRVYKWQIRNGKLTQDQAKRQTDVMLAIRADYRARIEAQDKAAPGPLFGGA